MGAVGTSVADSVHLIRSSTPRPLSVLHIITGLGDGGAEAVLYRLVTGDLQNRHRVISLMGLGKYGPLLQQAGAPVHALDMPSGRVTRHGLRRLWTLIRASDADVVQTWMYHADLVGGGFARLAGMRAIVWGLHNTYLDQRRTKSMARACAVASWVVPHTIISCSVGAARMHIDMGYAGRRVTVVPNGYDLSQFRRDPAARVRLRREWGLVTDEMAIGMVARWDPQKDHANLVAAMAHLDDRSNAACRLVLVGPGMNDSNKELTGVLQRYGWRERSLLLGQRADIASVMSALDLHVLPSVAEAFPNVVAEAMACEIPCVVTDTGDAALIVGDTGWVVPPRDARRLADTLQQALDSLQDPLKTRQRQVDARTRIESFFSLERMVQSYSQVWHHAATHR